MKENGVQGNFVPLSQRFLMHVVNVYVIQASLYSHIVMKWLSVWESITFIFMSWMRYGKNAILKEANMKLFYSVYVFTIMLEGLWGLNLKISNFTIKCKPLGDFFCLQHTESKHSTSFYSQFLIFFFFFIKKPSWNAMKWEPGFFFWKLLWLSFKSQNYKRIMGSK